MSAPLGVEIRSKIGDVTQAVTRAGETIRLEILGAWPRHTSIDVVVLDSAGHERARASMPYPRAGFGGHGFVVSPRETYLALHWYTGQSECACEVYELAGLTRVSGLPLDRGEGEGPVFASDESVLVRVVTTNAELFVEENDDGDPVDDPLTVATETAWARIDVLDPASDAQATCEVRVRLPAGSPAERASGFYPRVREAEAGFVRFDGGWGEQRIAQDREHVVIDGPPADLASP